ncbi:hypothetical protein [Streptomyces sp. NPDC057854]|uniref:hypothetical protein n=1 Tax=unclassified Streptomyces TaxID=2593676 RepID=UPI0036AC18D7
MTFEYRDAYGRVLTADHGLDDDDNPMAVLWARGEFGASLPVRIPADRVEEVVAGIRDAARTAAIVEAERVCALPNWADCSCNHLTGCEHPRPSRTAARQTTGQDDTQPDPAVVDRFIQHMATQHPAATHCCTNCDGIDPDTCLTNPHRAPAVGQPAEAHDTEPARVRIINHPGVLATADTEIAALLDAHAAEVRATVLREAADAIDAEAATGNLNAPEYGSHENVLDASALLRRMAEETSR